MERVRIPQVRMPHIAANNWPYLISGVGILLGLVLFGETLYVMLRAAPAPEGFPGGVVTSLPFIGGLIYGGRWLAASEVSPDRYGHVARWLLVTLIGAVLLIVGVIASMQPLSAMLLVGAVRWSAAIGGGIGLTVGLFHARSIQRAVEAEQARIRQQATQQERDRLEAFANIVAHDLRNPLNVADGHVDLLREECDSRHLDTIASAHDRMFVIIEDTLDLARAGRTVDETTQVELSKIAATCWETVESEDATLHTEGSVLIEADGDRLRQLLENLFRNAIDHGGADVTLRVGELPDRPGFYVEDDGPGIPEAERDQVFTSGYSEASEGTGLGLTIVETIIEAHGWEVEITDSEAGGARFEIFTGSPA